MNSSEMGWRPVSSHRPTHSSENFLFTSVYDIDININIDIDIFPRRFVSLI